MKIKDNVNMFRKQDNGQLVQCGRGRVTDFSFDRGSKPIFAYVDIWDDDKRKFSGNIQLLPIGADSFKLV